MTDNKRFVPISVERTDGFVQDHYDDKDLFSINGLCDLLNELNDENEELKQQYTQLKHHHSNLHDECAELELETNLLKNDIDSLLKFNNKASDLIEQVIDEGLVSEKAEKLLEKAIWWITDEG